MQLTNIQLIIRTRLGNSIRNELTDFIEQNIWEWENFSIKNRQEVFEKIDSMNQEVLGYLGIKLEKREECSVDYFSELLLTYKKAIEFDENFFVFGGGHSKDIRQKQFEKL